MKGAWKIMVVGTLLAGACSTSDTTSGMYGRDRYSGAQARSNTPGTNDVYRGNQANQGRSGVIEHRDISRDNPYRQSDTYNGSDNVNVNRIPDVNRSTGTGSGTGINTSPYNNNSTISNGSNGGSGINSSGGR
jgi:hypothetical protein